MKRHSRILFQLNDIEFSEMIKNASSYKEILNFHNFNAKGGMHRILKKRIKELNIDDSHLKTHSNYTFLRKYIDNKIIPLEKILIENSSYNRGELKRRLLKHNILKNECAICKLSNTWNKLPLVMIIDHINGVHNDNRIENLRILCPNCNSQQKTFAGRNHRNPKRIHYCRCGEIKATGAIACMKCALHKRMKVQNRPSKNELEAIILTTPMTKIGLKYGVSDNSVRKWCKNYGIPLINRSGYWTKLKYGKI